MLRFAIPLILLSGCAGTSVCDYDLEGHGWRPTDGRPADLLFAESVRDWAWFTNRDGDFLACYGSRKTCKGIYHLYEKQANGEHLLADEIVCTTS